VCLAKQLLKSGKLWNSMEIFYTEKLWIVLYWSGNNVSEKSFFPRIPSLPHPLLLSIKSVLFKCTSLFVKRKIVYRVNNLFYVKMICFFTVFLPNHEKLIPFNFLCQTAARCFHFPFPLLYVWKLKDYCIRKHVPFFCLFYEMD